MHNLDYTVDGLLYCGKCNTPKQGRYNSPFWPDTHIISIPCKCEQEKADAKRAEREERERRYERERRRRAGFLDRELQKCCFENDDGKNEKVMGIAKNYVRDFEHMKSNSKGLLFYGTVGTGKTFVAACIANALFDLGYRCLVTNFTRLINELSGMFEGKQRYLDSLNAYDLLVIDDLGVERNTEYMSETVTNIIDARYRSGLPLIVTTNLTSEELKTPPDIRKDRIYSRVLEMCIPVEVAGQDRRKLKAIQDYARIKEHLQSDNDEQAAPTC